jgi:hypothetical protein
MLAKQTASVVIWALTECVSRRRIIEAVARTRQVLDLIDSIAP